MDVSYIALAAVVLFFTRTAWQKLRGVPAASGIRSGIYIFLTGALFANSIPHFIHGVSGEYFPGPFFHSLGKGPATNISNVLWGLFCFGAGCTLLLRYRETHRPMVFRVLISSGFVAMSLFLSVVFSRGAFR